MHCSYFKLFLPALLCTVAAGCLATENHPRELTDRGTSALYTPNPDVPTKMTLWGKTQNLDRLDLYERLDRELTACTYTHGNTLLSIKRANRYRPQIIPILKRNGIPEDMFYLAVIESFLDNRAYSPAKAAGIWQFIPSTGRQYGLEINEYVDERYNLAKATEAACKYFKEAYGKYGDWNSVAAAYNGGMARISSEMESQQQKSALDLYLVSETSRYPFRIMAMKLIMENPEAYGFYLKPEQLYKPLEYDEVKVSLPVSDWVEWAKRHGLTYAQLREANPWIRAKSLPNKSGKTYTVLIPRKSSLYR